LENYWVLLLGKQHNDRNQSDPNELNGDFDDEKMAPVKSSYWLFIARENGNLYIFTLPELCLVYMVCGEKFILIR